MGGEPNGQTMRTTGTGVVALLSLALALGGCGTNNFGSSLDLFSSSSKATNVDAGTDANASATDIECPEVNVRTGAATLMIGNKPGEGEPAALDLRYQGTIIRTARECRVNAGIMTMKVGIEGRVITGPAASPGTIEIPLRLAVVREGVNPKTIVSKFARVPVTLSSAVDRVAFTHIDPDVSFPLPQPLSDIDAYVVYVGFDPSSATPEKKKPAVKPKPKRATKPNQT
jgi:hypothetical protein